MRVRGVTFEARFSARSTRVRCTMAGLALACLPANRLQVCPVEVGRGRVAVPVVVMHLQTVRCRRWETVLQFTARRDEQHGEEKQRSDCD
jgi:hypothetical protein